MPTNGFNEVAYGEYGHDQHEVVAHLRVIGVELHHGEKTQECGSGHISSAVEQYEAGDCGRYVAECHKFPYVSGSYYNDEIARESPGHSAYEGVVPAHTQGIEQDKESEHHHEQEVRWHGQSETIDPVNPVEKTVGRIRRRNLECGHAAEKRIGPQSLFAGGFFKEF